MSDVKEGSNESMSGVEQGELEQEDEKTTRDNEKEETQTTEESVSNFPTAPPTDQTSLTVNNSETTESDMGQEEHGQEDEKTTRDNEKEETQTTQESVSNSPTAPPTDQTSPTVNDSETMESNMDQGEAGQGGWKRFCVVLAGKTNDTHQEIIEVLKRGGHTEVSLDSCDYDYCVVICPVVSRVGTDISEALSKKPAGKPAILVVMHHTFDPEHVITDSRRQVENPEVLLTVDCLFFETDFLTCNRNRIAKDEIQSFLRFPVSPGIVDAPPASEMKESNTDQEEAGQRGQKSFCVVLAGKTNDTHREIIKVLKSGGDIEVDSLVSCDYCVVICPVVSRVGTDISEALSKKPAGKQAILVVMHHSFDPEHVITDSRRLVENPEVLLTVDCLFFDNRFLSCNRNHIAKGEIQRFLGFPVSSNRSYLNFPSVSLDYSPFEKIPQLWQSVKNKFFQQTAAAATATSLTPNLDDSLTEVAGEGGGNQHAAFRVHQDYEILSDGHDQL